MRESIEKQFILNGAIVREEQFSDSLVYEGSSIYEVIRMVNGTPVFFQDHMERLAESVNYQQRSMLANAAEIRNDILVLTGSVRKKENNIKVVFNFKEDSENYLIYFIHSAYPADEQYRKGVKGILFYAERTDPESKVINNTLRTAISTELRDEAAYEALLVNEDNLITEGSRSNIFFLKKDLLVTAPDNMILKGITRKHILQICIEKNINVEFRCVNADEISDFEAVFMTGTSPMVLPFSCIGEKFFNVKLPLMEMLRTQYLLRVEESIRKFREE